MAELEPGAEKNDSKVLSFLMMSLASFVSAYKFFFILIIINYVFLIILLLLIIIVLLIKVYFIINCYIDY